MVKILEQKILSYIIYDPDRAYNIIPKQNFSCYENNSKENRAIEKKQKIL